MSQDQLTTGELASMRAVCELTYPDAATISRVTYTSNGQGGRTATWATASTCDCRLSPDITTVEEITAGGRPLTREFRTITLPASTDINETDRIAIGGVTFEVTSIDAPRTYEITRRVEVVEID